MTDRSKDKEVARQLRKLEQRLRKELGPNDDRLKRFVRKAEIVVRELSTRPRSGKRLNLALAELLSELLVHGGENAEQ